MPNEANNTIGLWAGAGATEGLPVSLGPSWEGLGGGSWSHTGDRAMLVTSLFGLTSSQ